MHKDELWQEFAPTGEPIQNGGRKATLDNVTIEERRERGVLHGASVVWLFRNTKNGPELLFQQRSKFVDHPLDWDVSAGGHINYKESPLSAALREAKEEIGITLKPTDLELLATINTKYRFFMYIYLCDYTDKKDEFAFDDQEVAAVRWVPLKDADKFRKEYGKPGLAADDLRFDLILNFIKDYHVLKNL